MKRTLLTIIMAVCCTVSMSSRSKALLIGIGNYNTQQTGWAVIHGNNDVELLKTKLASEGFEITLLKDDNATKDNIVKTLKNMVAQTETNDVIYIHFSGHGQLIEDINKDEPKGVDQTFICYDACKSTDYKIKTTSYKGQNHLIDDELFPYLNILKKKVGKNGEVIVIFDSCYSGSADRGIIMDDPEEGSQIEWIETVRGSSEEFLLDEPTKDYLSKIKAPGNYTESGGSITIISACESYERNYECRNKYSGKCFGSLSYCISRMIDDKVPMSVWADYFKMQRYTDLRIFRPSQHPVIEKH